MKVKGMNGQIEFTGDRVIITRKGLLGMVAHGFAGTKEIPIKSISSVQLVKPSLFNRGYIQFTYHGGKEPGPGVDGAAKDENSVLLAKKHYQETEALKTAVIAAIAAMTTDS